MIENPQDLADQVANDHETSMHGFDEWQAQVKKRGAALEELRSDVVKAIRSLLTSDDPAMVERGVERWDRYMDPNYKIRARIYQFPRRVNPAGGPGRSA